MNSGYLKDSFDEGVQRKKSRMILLGSVSSSVDGGAVSWDRNWAGHFSPAFKRRRSWPKFEKSRR